MAGRPSVVVNGDFEHGLTGWRVVSGNAFAKQPVDVRRIGADKVEIHGRHPVSLGGDFWHSTAYPLGANETHMIRAVTPSAGILDSTPFRVSRRYLAYRLGGSQDKGSAIELRVSAKTAKKVGLKALDPADKDGFVAVRVAHPSGSDILTEAAWDLGGPKSPHSLRGAVAKVRLRMDASSKKQPRRLLVDHVRMMDTRPPRFRPPVWGWADIHCHPMAQAGFGDLLHGHMHGPVEDVGSCLQLHGYEHQNPLRPTAMFLEERRHNDGSLATTGWTTGKPNPDDELGFRGWPAFDEKTHLKTHQDWLRRAYDGGQRLMVALVVHNQLLAAISTATQLIFQAQSDRDTVEPQVQMLREFVAHNAAWCGIATTPTEARDLIEANKMAFVLGLETDSINDWVHDTDLVPDPANPDPTAIHAAIHDYFAYLKRLGVVQVNLIHLTDNAFGAMALYDKLFMVNSFTRRGVLPDWEDGWAAHANVDEKISAPVQLASVLWEKLEPVAQKLGITWPNLPGSGTYGHGDRNQHGLTEAGKVALVEAMRLGMVVDMDHMSEHSVDDAVAIARRNGPKPGYPVIAAHNGARALAPRPPANVPSATDTPQLGESRSPHAWPSESHKSETQLGYIKELGGMFGHGIAGADSRTFGTVRNECPGSSTTVAQGLQYIALQKELPVAFGTDWNALLTGPCPRFGPQAATGIVSELSPEDDWAALKRAQRLSGALAQGQGVRYADNPRDFRTYRFKDSGLFADTGIGPEASILWQALVLKNSGHDLDDATLEDQLCDEKTGLEAPALELARGLAGKSSLLADRGLPESHFHRAGLVRRAVLANDPNVNVAGEIDHVQVIVQWLEIIGHVWDNMLANQAPPLQRSTAGPVREFDYNLDGLSHYGMLPDMLQDLKNVLLPQAVLDNLFGSAESYIRVWEASVKAAATIAHPAPGVGP